MAAEIKITLPSISYLKGAIAINISPLTNPLLVDVAGENSMHDVVSLTTSDNTISKGNISTIGYVFVKNLDATNTITIGSDGITYVIMLKPGEYGFFRWNAAAFHARASAGTTTVLEYCFIET